MFDNRNDDSSFLSRATNWMVRDTIVCLATVALQVSPADAADLEALRVGVVTFLSGPAAESAGVPPRNAVNLMVDAINEGALPAPYQTKGAAGARLEVVLIDETGGPTKMVTEFRNLVQRRGVDLVLGFISSADCNAIAPVADELKTLTVFAVCAVTALEEQNYEFVFQTINQAGANGVGLARFVAEHYPEAGTVAGINQNYAWGRDSWNPFLSSLRILKPDIEVVDVLWPKLFAGQYNAEVSSLLVSRPNIIHSSLWGADLQSFIIQAAPRGLFDKSQVIFSAGGHIFPVIGDRLPDGTIIGFSGPHGMFMP